MPLKNHFMKAEVHKKDNGAQHKLNIIPRYYNKGRLNVISETAAVIFWSSLLPVISFFNQKANYEFISKARTSGPPSVYKPIYMHVLLTFQ